MTRAFRFIPYSPRGCIRVAETSSGRRWRRSAQGGGGSVRGEQFCRRCRKRTRAGGRRLAGASRSAGLGARSPVPREQERNGGAGCCGGAICSTGGVDVHEPSRGSTGHGGAVRAAAVAALHVTEGIAQMRQPHGTKAGPRDRGCGILTRHAATAAMARTPKKGQRHGAPRPSPSEFF
jgi:hypothetical protein